MTTTTDTTITKMTTMAMTTTITKMATQGSKRAKTSICLAKKNDLSFKSMV